MSDTAVAMGQLYLKDASLRCAKGRSILGGPLR